MSVYQLVPSPNLAYLHLSNYATWENAFSDEELNKIIMIGESLNKIDATVGTGADSKVSEDTRKSQISWISLNNDTSFIYDRIGYVARQLNGQFFGFNLYGFVEDLQYTTYRPQGDFYSWHMDTNDGHSAPRKLSLVLQLSDPTEYDGGELQTMTAAEPTTIPKKKGLIVAFPSFIVHRVKPVTRGVRRSLVVWLTGERFK